MIILDTDHIPVLRYEGTIKYELLNARLSSTTDMIATTVITLEEQMRDWLAHIHNAKVARKQIPIYFRLAKMFDFFARWHKVHFDDAAVDRFEQLKSRKTRIGTQDLKIASNALAHDATLISANLRDFRRVPGLRVENWLE